MCADYMDMLRQIDHESVSARATEVECLKTWNVQDLLAVKVGLMEYPSGGPKNHRWTVIATSPGGFVNVVRQTTKQSWLRGRWMAPTDIDEAARTARTVLVRTTADGTKVWLPLTHEPPRTISAADLQEEAFAERRPADDLPSGRCAQLRGAVAATPRGDAWDSIKRRWGLLDGSPGCPGCRACANS